MEEDLKQSLTSTRIPFVISSPVTVSSDRFMFTCSLYNSGCLHIHLLKSRAKAMGYCHSQRKRHAGFRNRRALSCMACISYTESNLKEQFLQAVHKRAESSLPKTYQYLELPLQSYTQLDLIHYFLFHPRLQTKHC